MASKADTQASTARLYLISPRLAAAEAFVAPLEAALDAGDVACLLLDLRGTDPGAAKKITQTLAPLAQGHDTALLIEGDPRLVARSGADGAHLSVSGDGLEDAVADAVESLKPDRIVGCGALKSRHDAMTAGEADIDYVMFGEPAADGWTPSFETTLEKTAWWSEIFNVPCVAYATTLARVGPLAEAGADFIALGGAVWDDPRGPASAVRDATAAIRASRRSA